MLSAEQVTAKFLEIEGLDASEYDVRSLGGLGDRRFIAAVRDGKAAFPDFGTALAAHRIVDACYRSAASGVDVLVAG